MQLWIVPGFVPTPCTPLLSCRPLADRALLVGHPGFNVGETATDATPQSGVVRARLAGCHPLLLDVGHEVFSPEPMNFIMALVAEMAIRSRPGPEFGSVPGWPVTMMGLPGPLAFRPEKSIRYRWSWAPYHEASGLPKLRSRSIDSSARAIAWSRWFNSARAMAWFQRTLVSCCRSPSASHLESPVQRGHGAAPSRTFKWAMPRRSRMSFSA